MKKGNPYGTHRVISPKGVLPQPADVIDNDMEIYDNEIVLPNRQGISSFFLCTFEEAPLVPFVAHLGT